jgi:protein involved in polysaccharide export with SLBB domain
MIEQLRKSANHWVVALGVVLAMFFSGCKSQPKFPELPPEAGNIFHVGDQVSVKCLGPSGIEVIPEHTERVHEDGTITLSLIGPVKAVGKTAGELQRAIHDLYVPRYFPELTATVSGAGRFFYVLGDVVSAGEKTYPGDMTVVKAIAAAGGFTEFAKRTNVELTHAGHTRKINVQKALQDDRYDAPVFPGDRIFVHRRIF